MSEIESPANIKVLLHCFCNPEPYPHPDCAAIKKLLALGAIEPAMTANVFRTTPLGEAWVKALCNVPVPTVAYIDEQGRVLKP